MIDFDKEVINFDNKKYNFDFFLNDLFDCKNLEQIHLTHKHLLPDSQILSKKWPYNENSSDFHSIFYQKLNEPWEEIVLLYENFVVEYVSKNIGEDFLYQSLSFY